MSQKNDNSEIIYGKHAVLELLMNDNDVNKFYVQNGLKRDRIKDILDMVKKRNIVISEVPKEKIDALTNNGNHQGVAVSVPPIPYQSLSDCFALAKQREEDPFFLILDGIEDPHNLGSIIRTADATGVHGIIIPKRRAVGLTNVVAKTSTGAIEHVPIVRVTNLSQTISQLKEKGLWVFATAMNGEDMRDWNSKGPIALIIGNEGQGVSDNLLKNADGIVTIPMVGHVQSLNASVATAVLAYEVARHRMKK
ncbi:23S rRNA (guanosine(2251)-2'-O)-methyltransferase RlmB [Aerococcaceae bacterium DSM 111020]|nr:23S rRNA (guanosine(2251)-2'-O)-methyltransferase RlmB [Aerococcaceae bacterium DSM 111020]